MAGTCQECTFSFLPVAEPLDAKICSSLKNSSECPRYQHLGVWHESDCNTHILLSKSFSITRNFSWFQFIFTSYAWLSAFEHCSIDYCGELILVDKNLCENFSFFTLKWFPRNSFGEMCTLDECYRTDAKNSNFEFFRNALDMKSWRRAYA